MERTVRKFFDVLDDRSFIRRYWIWIFIVSYACKWIYLFHKVDFTSEFPIVDDDYVQYYARVLRIFEFLKHGHFWGYDPYEMAGYPAILREVGTFFMAVIAYALSGLLSAKTTVLWCEIIGNVGVPLLIIPTIRNFGGKKAHVLAGFAMFAVMYGGIDMLSTVAITQGIFGFLMGCFVAVWHVSLFWRWLHDKRWSSCAWLAFASVVLPQVHPSAAVIGAVPLSLMLLLRAKYLRAREWAQLLGVLAVALAGNLYWIRGYLAYSDWIDVLFYWPSGWGWFWQLTIPFQPTWFYCIRAFVHVALIGACVFSLRLLKSKAPPLFIVFVGWLAWMSLIVFEGSFVPFINTLQPFRFVFALWLVIVVCCAVGFDETAYKLRTKIIGVEFMLIGLLAGWLQVLTITSGNNVPLFTTRLTDGQTPFLNYMCHAPSFDGRLMLECGYRRLPNIADITAVLSKRPLLGGHDPGNFLKARFTLFGGIDINLPADPTLKKFPVAFGRPLIQFRTKPNLFLDYLRLYNVTDIAAWSADTIYLLNQFPALLTLTGKIGEYNMYHVRDISPSWFQQGAGRLTMDYDQLTITNASPGIILLKCHWIRTLKITPALPMRPVYLMKDPVPFIEIDNTRRADVIRIYNDGL
jgi:hypothetical protein